jgi:hypothetical protein
MCQAIVRRLHNPSESYPVRKVARLLARPLRRHGEKMASRGGKNAKKRAVVAVARKLSVLLHRLWVTAEVYDPLYNARRRTKQEEAA